MLDHTSTPLPADYFDVMSLQPRLDSASQQYVKITPLNKLDSYTARYQITGVELGTAHLEYTVRSQANKVIKSNKVDIQVRNSQ